MTNRHLEKGSLYKSAGEFIIDDGSLQRRRPHNSKRVTVNKVGKMATQEIIDFERIGRKGVPRHYQAFGIEPPMKTVPVNEQGEPEVDHPPLSEEEIAQAARKAAFPNLEPDKFWFVVRASGHEEDLRAWVASLNDPASIDYDPMAWAVASAKLDKAKYFERDHPLVEAAREAIGLSAEELDDLWRYAAS